MSIATLREAAGGIPGSETLTMRYANKDGQEVQVFEFGEKSFELPMTASNEEIIEAMRRVA